MFTKAYKNGELEIVSDKALVVLSAHPGRYNFLKFAPLGDLENHGILETDHLNVVDTIKRMMSASPRGFFTIYKHEQREEKKENIFSTANWSDIKKLAKELGFIVYKKKRIEVEEMLLRDPERSIQKFKEMTGINLYGNYIKR